MAKLINCNEFKKKYNIEDEVMEKANIKWLELEIIYNEYEDVKKKSFNNCQKYS